MLGSPSTARSSLLKTKIVHLRISSFQHPLATHSDYLAFFSDLPRGSECSSISLNRRSLDISEYASKSALKVPECFHNTVGPPPHPLPLSPSPQKLPPPRLAHT